MSAQDAFVSLGELERAAEVIACTEMSESIVLVRAIRADGFAAGLRAGLQQSIWELAEHKDHYPADVFIEPPPGEHGSTVDACSARAVRHACEVLLKRLRKALTDANVSP